ncbi:MAG: phospholipase D-like domain-containing protein [Polyangiaceae bacterium]
MASRLRSSVLSMLLGVTSLALLPGCDVGPDTESDDVTAGFPEKSAEAQAMRAFLNDPATTAKVLTSEKITSTVANLIVAHRDGADGVARTADDDAFDTVAEVDALKGVGSSTLQKLASIASKRGYLAAEKAKKRSVIFSPQAPEAAHTAEIAKIIDGAARSIDVAMYSYSDATVGAALANAVKRGVKVRFVFDTATDDKNADAAAKDGTKSGKLELAGIDVRAVNKIMHHKFMIVDGPRDDAAAAKTATIVSGSANWSNGAATKYDENTLFMTAYPEVALRLQREFNTMWEHAKDFTASKSVPFEASTLAITDDLIPNDPGLQIFFTSSNFSVKDQTFSSTGANTISDELVRAIDAATDHIHIASGHMRSRPVAEALMRKSKDAPNVEITIYLDGQEYVSESGNAAQKTERETCLAAANTEAKQRACIDKDYYYGRDVELAGANVHYKYYAYRWDASYAAQMHDKIFIVDDALYTGSYNLSDNAEHNTFENLFLLRGPEFADLVDTYEQNFDKLWTQGEGLLPGLTEKIDNEATIPLVFPAMSLEWTEVRDLKALIAKECPAANSVAYRLAPAAHQTCVK